MDYLTGEHISFSIFYLLPICLAAWCGGRALGMAFSVGCAVLWCVIDINSSLAFNGWFVEIWNAGVRLGFFVIVTASITAIRAALQNERRLSRTDSLTQLSNARSFLECLRLEIERSRRYNHPLSLGYLDLDDFKAVNDNLGHAAGDRLLQTVAEVLAGCLRVTDVAGRMGGDEFAVLLPETEGAEAELIFARIRERLAGAATEGGWPVGFSAGIVTFAAPAQDAEAAMHAADELMYEVKRAGKNNVRQVTSG